MCREAACSHSVVLNRKPDAGTSGAIRRFFVKNVNYFENICLEICIIRKIVLSLYRYPKQSDMATVKEKIYDIILDINIAKIANRYFGKSSGWLYHKLDQRDGNGKEIDFSPEELDQFKGALYDLSDRIRKAADAL